MAKTLDDIKKIIYSQHDGLLNDNKLNHKIILLTLSGSTSYGTNIETSDIDLRGICLENTNDLLGLSHFEHYTDQHTDTVIYGLRKFIKLCLQNNPNILELLGTKDEHIIKISKEGELLRNHVHLFLSRQIINTYGNYALNQQRQLKEWMCQSSQTKDYSIKNESIQSKISKLNSKYPDIHIKAPNPSTNDYLSKEQLSLKFNDKKYSFSAVNQLIIDLKNVIKSKKRSSSLKDPQRFYKTAIHVLRLLNTGTELLNGKALRVYRENERSLYLDIRSGKHTFKDLLTMIDDAKFNFDEASKYTTLPEQPNYEAIEQLMIQIYKTNLTP